jgi:phosphatidylserine/phosphatidylglycerophosphate/cardiolipin synthase-like enzyme
MFELVRRRSDGGQPLLAILCSIVIASVAGGSVAPSAAAATSPPSSALTLLTEPKDGVAPILSAIRHAHHQIDLVMYENEGKRIDAALAAADHRGVHVRVLLSNGYYGMPGTPKSDNQAAYQYFEARRVPVRWSPAYFALTHQKTLVVDGVAYILTFNFTPQYYATSRDFGLIDTLGGDVRAIEKTFDADWSKRRIASQNGADLVWSPGSRPALIKLIRSAHGWLDIYNEEMNATRIESALESDARRGVNVRITMTASSSWSAAFARLTAAGVHVHLYPATARALYIHAKMILTPSQVFLGSENFSESSMSDNRELGLITSSKPIRTALSRTFNGDYAGAKPFRP